MNPALLIDSIVQQTMVLIAQLATSAGFRAPLSHIADRVLLDLSRELQSQGVTQKVRADMFGMALRTYQKHTHRLMQSETDRTRSIWEAIFEYISRRKSVARSEVMRRFSADDENVIRSILRDMVQSGLLFESGTGSGTVYKVATEEDREALDLGIDADEAATFLWAAIYRLGPVTLKDLGQAVHIDEARLLLLTERLLHDGRVTTDPPDANLNRPDVRLKSASFVVPLNASAGWAAAVWDHYHAVVRTVITRLRGDDSDHPYPQRAGGSTWSFDIWPGHPHEEEILGLLNDLRERVRLIQEKVFAHNEQAGRPSEHARVTVYLGQSVGAVVQESPGTEKQS